MLIDMIDVPSREISKVIKPSYYEEYRIGYTVGLMTPSEYENPYSKNIDVDSMKSYWSGFYEGRKKRGAKWI